MATIKGFLTKWQTIQIEPQIVKIIQGDAKEIVQLNQDQLYKQSVDSVGVPLRLYGSIAYALDKQKLNPNLAFGRPDLRLSGAFYRGFTLNAGYTGIFTIDSTDSKTPKLEDKYGNKIFGLTVENKKKYALGTFKRNIFKYLGARTGIQVNT